MRYVNSSKIFEIHDVSGVYQVFFIPPAQPESSIDIVNPIWRCVEFLQSVPVQFARCACLISIIASINNSV